MMRNKAESLIPLEALPSKCRFFRGIRFASFGLGIVSVTTLSSSLGCSSFLVILGMILQVLGIIPMHGRWWFLFPPLLVVLAAMGWWAPIWTKTGDQLFLYGAALGGPLTVFSLSLRRGEIPLLTQIAEGVHGSLRLDVQRYTRCLTWGWVVFFILALVAPAFLWVLAPHQQWWHYPLGGGALAVALCLFLVEIPVRRLFIRQFDHATLGQNLRAGYMVFMKKH